MAEVGSLDSVFCRSDAIMKNVRGHESHDHLFVILLYVVIIIIIIIIFISYIALFQQNVVHSTSQVTITIKLELIYSNRVKSEK